MTMTFMAVCAVVKLADYDPKPPALARLNLQKNEEPRLEMKNGKKKTPELRNRSGEPAPASSSFLHSGFHRPFILSGNLQFSREDILPDPVKSLQPFRFTQSFRFPHQE